MLVDPDDLTCWSSALNEILHNKLFSEKISGIAYREFRQKYTWEFRAKRILSNATGKTNYKSYLGVAIPENPTQADINEANGILGRPVDVNKQSGGIIGQSDMSAKRVSAPKKNKKKVPQYYKGGGTIKKKYAYGGRVAKYKG